jgi:diguanylate cyclase (GGDEF)-like protein
MGSLKRHSVGILIGYHLYEGSRPNRFTCPLIRGMQAAARDNTVHLMVACGVARRMGLYLHRPAWPELDTETDFAPVGPWNTDGLIFIAPLLKKQRIQYARKLVDEGFPVFFLGGDSDYPAIVVDNEGGIRQAMDHLVQHGHSDIAFIAGDEKDLGDSATRVKAYRQGVFDLDLNADSRLMEYGQHWDDGGYNAMRRMLQSGVKFTAVMCSNDLSALGAMRALKEAGIRIPQDVALVGFDDVLEGLAQIPPLTSVHYPLFETGYRALLLLLKRIEQGPNALPDITRVSTWLVPRQSCGCLPEMVTTAVIGPETPAPDADQSPRRIKDGLALAMQEKLEAEGCQTHGDDLSRDCGRVADSFLLSMEGGDFSHFQNALLEILQHMETTSDDDVYMWQSVISILRQGARAILKEDRDSLRAGRVEDLLHQARALLSESDLRRHTRLKVQQTNDEESMARLTARLLSSSDEGQLYTALREDLPQVGVRSCYVVFFEPQGDDPVAVSSLQSLAKDEPPLRFETRKFPPPGLYPEGEAFSLAILPLFFREEIMGYVVFDGGNLDPLAMLVRQLSSSIKNVQLHAKVLELSLTDALTAIHNRRYFEIMLQKEVDRSQRYSRDLAVIMIDIDHFKLYNDAFGHPAGDRALQEVAHCITRGARRGLDVVSRYGGEEFVIILPETNTEGAKIVAEKIRDEMAASRAFLRPTTVSLGIASLRGERLRAQLLVDQADRALYQAKNQGRDLAVVFEEWMLKAAHPQGADGGPTVAAAPGRG